MSQKYLRKTLTDSKRGQLFRNMQDIFKEKYGSQWPMSIISALYSNLICPSFLFGESFEAIFLAESEI